MTQAFNLAQFANFLNTSGRVSGSGLQSGLATQWTTNGTTIYYNTGSVVLGTTAVPGGASGQLIVYENSDITSGIWIRNDSNTGNSIAAVVLNAAGNSWRIGMGSANRNGNALTFDVDVSAPNTKFRISTAGDFLSVVPSGSNLIPSYFARVWVNFNGRGTVTIRNSGNVSSITDLGVGQYRVNFSTAMPDTTYCYQFTNDDDIRPHMFGQNYATYPPTTTSVTCTNRAYDNTADDVSSANVTVYR